MKTIKRIMSIFIIILFLISIKGCVFAKNSIVKPDNIGPQTSVFEIDFGHFSTQENYYCIEQGDGWEDPCKLDLAKENKKYVYWQYRSDDTDPFDRAIAYVLRGKDSTGRDYAKGFGGRNYGNGWYDNRYYDVGLYSIQQALWGIEYEFNHTKHRNLTGPFLGAHTAEGAVYNQLMLEAWGNGNGPASKKYTNDKKNKAKITTSGLTMNDDTGTITIKELVGKVQRVVVTWSDGEEKDYSGEESGSESVEFFKNSAKTQAYKVKDFSKGKIYIKNKRQKDIVSIKFDVSQEANGWCVNVYKWENRNAAIQDLISIDVDEGKPSSYSKTVKVQTGEITVKKEDYESGKALNGAKFAIFKKDSGWLGYNAKEDNNNPQTGTVTYEKSWANAYKFETGKKFKTGKSYCGLDQLDGEFTLNTLKFGTYYVFEIEPATGYLKETKYGWNTTDGSGSAEKEHKDAIWYGHSEWDMGNTQRVLIGNKKYEDFKKKIENSKNSNPTSDNLEAYNEIKALNKPLWKVDGMPEDKSNLVIGTNSSQGQTLDATFIVRNKKGGLGLDAKLTIRKVDYDDYSLLNGFKFAIFKKDEGWLGYDANWVNADGQKTGKVTYGNSWKNAYKFETGKGDLNNDNSVGQSYCGTYRYDGEFTLKGLTYGYYYVFEIGTNGSEYSLIGQKGYSTLDGDGLFEGHDNWQMKENGKPIPRILCGNALWQQELVNVDMLDGTSYDFRFSDNPTEDSVNYIRLANYLGSYSYTDKETNKTEIRNATKHAIYTIKNRKDTELKIVKKDQDTEEPIQGVGIKILVNLREHIYSNHVDLYNVAIPGNTEATSKAWYWLKENGKLTQDYTEAGVFKTNVNGEIKISKVPYGLYCFYETEALKGYKLEEQEGYRKGQLATYHLDDNRQNKFFDGKYVELGITTIIPKAYTGEKKNVGVLSGDYTIEFIKKDEMNNSYVIDIYDDNIKEYVDVKLYKRSRGNLGQTLRISYIETGNYLIFNANRKKYITCTSDGTPVRDAVLEDCLQGESSLYTSQQWKFIPNEDGSYNIETRKGGKKQTNLHVYEGKTVDGNRIVLQNPEKSVNQNFKLNPKSDNQNPTNENGNRKFTLNATNKYALTELGIIKVDKTYKADTGASDSLKLSGAEFKIYGKDVRGSNNGWVKQTRDNNVIKTEYTTYDNATTFTADNEGKVDIKNLKEGTYYIFETKAPTGYDITSQTGYKVDTDESGKIPGTSDLQNVNDWVYLGKSVTKVDDTPECKTEVVLTNTKYASLKGKVWLDNPDGKANKINNIYNQNENDLLLNNISVKLYSNKNNTLIASTTTNERGEYVFTKKENGDKLTYWEFAYCHVEFIYDNKEYIVATPFTGNNLSINSKAQEKEVITIGGKDFDMGELYDGNLSGINEEEGKFPGRAVTYQGATTGLDKIAIDNNKNANNNQKILTSFYNDTTFTIEDINLGLIKKLIPSFDVGQQIECVKIKRGNYTFTYKMGDAFKIDMKDEATKKIQSTVAYQNSARTFSQALYPSDIKYNFVDGRTEDDKFKVYVVYRIMVRNNTTHNLQDLYKETSLNLTSLTDTFDSYRYELNNDNIGYSEISGTDLINTEIGKWTQNNSNNNEAVYDLNESALQTIGINETESTYIQFKVTDKFLVDIANLEKEGLNEINETAPSLAKASGYHMYKRFDKNWKDQNEYDHRTVDYTDESAQLGIIWQLADTRKVLGEVFEDNKVNNLAGEVENKRKDERIGNGYKDDNEKLIEDVIVTLMDANTDTIAKVYNGELTEKDGIWSAVTQDAVVNVQNGQYQIADIVPGRYYLKFTYGNGETEYTDVNGNKINISTQIKEKEDSNIDTHLYKSTIVTGAAKNATTENEKEWFLDSITQGKYSVATDLDEIINRRMNNTEEIKYNTTSNETINIAESPKMNIQFEYIPKDYIDANEIDREQIYDDKGNIKQLRSNCTGMSFGIIERPHVNIELVKTIRNVELTLQNGTTIINGNPKENISPFVSSIDEGNAKLELNTAYLYGSNAIVTYSLAAHNRSELDYAEPDYYKYGRIEANTEPVSTTVTKIVDYLNNNNASYDNQGDNVRVLNNDDINKTEYFSQEVLNKNKDYKQTIFEPNEVLFPEAYGKGKTSTADYEFTVNNLLSTSDGILGWESYSEIIGIRNVTLTPQSISRSGNFVVGDRSTIEPDSGNATVSIYSSTGENRDFTIYYIIGGSLLVIACGVILIKKIVKSRKA